MGASGRRGNGILILALVALICAAALFFVPRYLNHENTEHGADAYSPDEATVTDNGEQPDQPQETQELAEEEAPTEDVIADFIVPVNSEAETVEETAAAAGIIGWGFYYDQLTEEEQEDYRAICTAFNNDQYTEIAFPAVLTDDQFDRVHYAIKYDHPEYFWVGESTVYYTNGQRDAIFKYSEKNVEDDIPQMQTQLRAAADEILSGLPADAGEYEKAKYIYEQIIDRTEYHKPSADDQNIKSVLLNHESVCTGYARTYQYLATLCGLKVTTVNGFTDESHSWCLQMIDGGLYWTDVTYGDPINSDEASRQDLRYDYLCVPDRLVSRHTILSEPDFTYPGCTDESLYYYAADGVMLNPFSAAEAVEAAATQADRNADTLAADGEIVIHYLFRSGQDYEQMLRELADQNSEYHIRLKEEFLNRQVFATGYSEQYSYLDETMHIAIRYKEL